MTSRDEIRFLLNGREMRLGRVGASEMALDFLRLDRRLTGTKEGCAEGDCGACTVIVSRLAGETVVHEPVNACIRPLATLDGCAVTTIEGLGTPADPHPLQTAMVAHHASQCGFCTPGVVMALAATALEGVDEAGIDRALQGNLCRCTGYAPIIRAAQAASWSPPSVEADRLRALRDGARVEMEGVVLPANLDDFAALRVERPDARVVAGATDVGLWVTKDLREIAPAIFIGHLDEMRRIERAAAGLRLFAGVTYAQAEAPLLAEHPHLADLWSRIGGPQVRAMGSIGGNIANGSPIGDTPPALIALGARLTLRRGDARREIALEDFFLDYGKQDLRAGEFVEAVLIPPPDPAARHACYKLSKRRDEDISTLCAAFTVTVAQGAITAARIAFGGMAATPRRAHAVEAALVGGPWSEAALLAAAGRLEEDFSPISDMRASAVYRMVAARNLFRRFWLEQSGATARLAVS